MESTIIWDGIDGCEIDETGKYLSESIFGLMTLETDKSASVAFPIKSNFAGVDSFNIRKNAIIPISSKYGKGAPAQAIPLMMKCGRSPSDSELNKFLQCLENYPLQREAIYDYAFNKVLDLDIDIHQLYLDAVDNDVDSPLLKNVLSCIKKDSLNTSKIEQVFPASVTSYAAKVTASSLSKCPMTEKKLKAVLKDLGIWQVNACRKSWHDGKIGFYVKSTWNCSFSLYYGKSEINNLEANRGLLTYRLKD